MERLQKEKKVQQAGCCALFELSGETAPSALGENMGAHTFESVLEAMERHADAVGVQKEGCDELVAFHKKGDKKLRAEMMRSNMIDLVVYCMQKFKYEADLQL